MPARAGRGSRTSESAADPLAPAVDPRQRGADPDARSRQAEALDQLIDRERSWHDLTVLRFLSHPGFLAVFPEYLIGVYHSMRTACALMEAARRQSVALAPGCQVAARLVEYWTRHIEDEAGHDRWMLEDLVGLCLDAERDLARPPLPEVAELMGTLHFWVLHTHPVAALTYFYVAERNPPSVRLLDWMVADRGVPRSALRTFYRHAVIDVEHGRELAELVNALPLTAAQNELMALSTTTVLRHLARIMERHIAQADERRA